MGYLLLGGLALLLIVWGRGKRILPRREWRFLTSAVAIVAFAGAAYAGVRGAWGAMIVLLAVGLSLAVTSRQPGQGRAAPPPVRPSDRMSEAQARSILGVGPDATPAEIKAAYKRLMRMAHPDKGGTTGLAAQLNAARDRLLGS